MLDNGYVYVVHVGVEEAEDTEKARSPILLCYLRWPIVRVRDSSCVSP